MTSYPCMYDCGSNQYIPPPSPIQAPRVSVYPLTAFKFLRLFYIVLQFLTTLTVSIRTFFIQASHTRTHRQIWALIKVCHIPIGICICLHLLFIWRICHSVNKDQVQCLLIPAHLQTKFAPDSLSIWYINIFIHIIYWCPAFLHNLPWFEDKSFLSAICFFWVYHFSSSVSF